MGTSYIPESISAGLDTTSSLNTNLTNIQTSLSRMVNAYGDSAVGSNAMQINFDLNSNKIINAADGTAQTDYLTLRQIQGLITSASVQDVTNASVVTTVANLKALTVSGLDNLHLAITKGHTSVGDNGDGTYYYDSSASDTDNGGSILAPDVGTGRWFLLYNEGVNVKQFGAIGDGSNDDTAAIQAAYDYAASTSEAIARFELPVGDGRITSGSKSTVIIPKGKYKTTSTITVSNNTITRGERAYVFSETLTYPLFTASTFNTEWKGLILDGGTYHIWFTDTVRIEAAMTHIHDCEFRVAKEYCVGDDISTHYNYPMAVHIDNIKSYGSSFAYLHNNGTFIKDSWIAWDTAATGVDDNPLFECSNPFVLDNITEVPFGTNANRTPRIRSTGSIGPHGSRSLSLTCKNVRFGGEATATPIVSTDTESDADCDLNFIDCSMFGVADYYWAEFNGNLPRRLTISGAQGVDSGGFTNCLGMRVATTTDPLAYEYGTFMTISPDTPAVAQRLVVTDTRTGTTIPTGASPADWVFDPEVKINHGLSLTNEDPGNGFSLFAAPYTTTGTAAHGGTINTLGYAFSRWDFQDPNENVKIKVPSLSPSGGAGVYSCSVYVIPQNGSATFNCGYEKSTSGAGEITTNSGLCEVGINIVTWKFYYNGTDPVDSFFNISSIASVGNTQIAIGGVVINKGDTVGTFVPKNTSSVDQARKVDWGETTPTDGTWTVGQIRYDPTPSFYAPVGRVCLTAGTPGTWRAFGITISEATTAELADISNAINTSSSKVEGWPVYNSTTKLTLIAAGNANNSVWVYQGTGATAHTPV